MLSVPGFSVIIPVFNRAEQVCNAIQSVLNQSKAAAEIIVVDDGSTDETREKLNRFGDKLKILHQPNSGVAATRNRGIMHANCAWLTFLDSDDTWHPHKLERAVWFIQSHPQLNILHTNERWFRNGSQVTIPRRHQKPAGDIFKASLSHCVVAPSSVVVKQSLLERVGCFDTELTVCEDYDLWLRIARDEAFGFDAQPLVNRYSGHPDQLSARYWGMDRFRVQSLEKLLRQYKLSDEQIKAALATLLGKLKRLAAGYRKHGRDTTVWDEKIKFWQAQTESGNFINQTEPLKSSNSPIIS